MKKMTEMAQSGLEEFEVESATLEAQNATMEESLRSVDVELNSRSDLLDSNEKKILKILEDIKLKDGSHSISLSELGGLHLGDIKKVYNAIAAILTERNKTVRSITARRNELRRKKEILEKNMAFTTRTLATFGTIMKACQSNIARSKSPKKPKSPEQQTSLAETSKVDLFPAF